MKKKIRLGFGDFFQLNDGKTIKVVGRAMYHDTPLILFCYILSGGSGSEVYALKEEELIEIIEQ